MKVMTNHSEAYGLQSRTEVKQSMAKMAAPNHKSGKASHSSGASTTSLWADSSLAAGNLLACRRLLFFILFVLSMGNALGQVTNVTTGVIDESHIGDYNTLKSSYPLDLSSLVTDVTSWSGTMANENSNHWSGSTTAYANTASFSNGEVNKETTLNLPKGDYVILAAGRGSSSGDVTIFMSVGGNEVTMGSRGATGKGVNTSGEASFSSGTFANSGNGCGWQYFYIKFSVAADAYVTVKVGGRTSASAKWVSISTPFLWEKGTDLTADMFYSWDGPGLGANDNGKTTCVTNFKTSQSDGATIYGDGDVNYLKYADLSNYSRMMVSFEGSVPRFLFNRVSDGGDLTEVNSAGTYATVTGNLITIDLKKLASENGGYAHLNAIKVNWGQTSNIKAVNLDPFYPSSEAGCQTHVIYQKYYDNEWQKIFPVDMGSLKDKILSCLGKSDISEIGNIYLRWYIADLTTNSPIRDGAGMPISMKNPVLAEATGHYQENDGMLWFHNSGVPAFSSDDDFKNAFNVSVNLNSTTNFFQNNIQMVCVVTEDLTGIAPQHEPVNLQHKFIIRFLGDAGLAAIDFPVTSEAPAKVYGKIVSGISDSDNAYNLQSVLTELYNQAKASGEALDGKTPKYARFYLTSSSGVIKDATSFFTAGGGNALSNYQNKGSKGLVWSNDAWPGDFLISNLVANKSASDSWADLRIVCDLTDDMSGSYKVGDLLMEEPTHLTARLIVGFAGTEPEPTGFEGKLSKDAFTHTREIMMTATDVTNGYVVVPLAESFETILSDYNTTAEGLDNKLHIRWYVTCNGAEVANSETLLAPVTTGKGHLTKAGEGIYWNSATSGLTSPWTGNPTSTSDAVKDILNVKFSKTDASKRWDEYKVVVVMSNDATEFNGQIVSGGELVQEPRRLNMMFTYTIYREDEFLFVHHKGASDRDYLTSGDDSNISTTSPSKQYSWNNPNSSIDAWPSSDIRQGVHTVEYDVYLKKADGAKNLLLPFESYTGGGNNLEPMAYIRWYDWATDMGSSHLNQVGTWLENKTDVSGSRGLFMLNNSWIDQHPIHSKVGVTYDPSSLADAGDIIACDVSKYYDGIYKGVSPDSRSDFNSQGFTMPVLIHEPTLSTRYLFHVYPSTVIASKIKTGDDRLSAALSNLVNGSKTYSEVRNTMFNLCEDNGRVIVSLNGSAGDFALRAQLQSLEYYFLEGGNLQCSQIEWYAYLEDEKGLWLNATPLTVKEQKGRVYKFDLSYLNGTYSLQSNTTDSKSVTAAPGMRFHIVGRVGGRDGSYTLHESNAIHYELQFVNAPAYLAEDLLTKDVKRTDEYLQLHLDPAGKVTFDDYFPDMSEPTTEDANYRIDPLPWNQAQYGFCYPSIDKYRIATKYSGMSPIHGDYILLKSIMKPGISAGTSFSNMQNNIPDVGYQHVYLWYNWGAPELDDYTHTVLNNSQYGGFFYVDASDESRTIATLDFSANLCSGSQIYFTAALADATSGGATSPQLMAHVYAYEKDALGHRTGEKKLVISFLTCVLNTVNKDDGGYKYHKWYQVYGYGTIPESINISDYDDFTVEIDNYSKDTNGADFCVDQISFYTSTAQVNILQSDVNCGVDYVTMDIFMDGENLKAALGASDEKKTIYWSICDEAGNPLEGQAIYENTHSTAMEATAGDGYKYGKIQLTPNYQLNADGTPTESFANEGFFKGTDNNIYFRLLNKGLPLEEGVRYYVSVYSLNNIPVAAPNPDNPNDGWGAPTVGCTVCSSYFVAQKMHLAFSAFGGDITGTIEANCDGTAKEVTTGVELKRPDSTQPSGFQTYTGYGFDFFRGTKTELLTSTGAASIDIFATALRAFREWDNTNHGSYTDYQTNASQLASDIASFKGTSTENATNGALIETVADKLILAATSTFKDQMSGTDARTFDYMAFSIAATTSTEDGSKAICSPLAFSFNYIPAAAGPLIELGFPDVTYPDGEHRVIRLGLEQLDNMKDDYTVHIPVHSYLDKDRDKTKATQRGLKIKGNLVLYASTDPTLDLTSGTKIAAVFTQSAVNATNNYLSLDFHGTGVDGINYHEGYAYEMKFEYREDGDADSDCDPTCLLTFKIVPKYATWYNTDNNNWNNDGNWRRSQKSELNSNTYQNNNDIDSRLDNYQTNYVPMKFTYVTIPSSNKAPCLINLTSGGDGLYNNIGNSPNLATSDIQYDLLVKYETDADGKLIGLCSHTASGNIYDCEKFYGNWCKEIYFKPSAELINQQYLTYGKAWVEKELTANKWYLASAPLQNTYAGDLYVPSYDSETNGQQLTEAFKSIVYDPTTYSRTKYPIYQHSWGKEAKVFTKTDDVRATNYSAAINFTTVTSNLMEWSHTYNDVQVPYTTLTGFAVRAHRRDQVRSAIIRLPKEDISYDYYQWDNTSPSGVKVTQSISKPVTGKFVTDGTANVPGLTYGVVYGSQPRTAGDGTLTESLSTLQAQGGYVLVGNPYMSSIKMSKFFDVNNAALENHNYWTYEGNNIGAYKGTGTIHPLQAFFVKATGDLKFTPDMMVDGNNDAETTTSQAVRRRVAMTAAASSGTSHASVELNDEAMADYVSLEDVETLFDSNLSDVPMVFTVAGAHAVSIDVRPSLDVVPFGVACAASNALVEVNVDHSLEAGRLFVLDAVTGSVTEVGKDGSVMVQPNDYGRYFLTTNGDATGLKQMAADGGIVVSVRDKQVVVKSGQDLQHVRILTTGGATVSEMANCGTEVSFRVSGGVYIVEAQTAETQKTVKIMVK